MICKFTEVLNDLVDYFILGDILLLEEWKNENNLSDDLATEFTINESGDRVFDEGIVIPMSGIENYPYTMTGISSFGTFLQPHRDLQPRSVYRCGTADKE